MLLQENLRPGFIAYQRAHPYGITLKKLEEVWSEHIAKARESHAAKAAKAAAKSNKSARRKARKGENVPQAKPEHTETLLTNTEFMYELNKWFAHSDWARGLTSCLARHRRAWVNAHFPTTADIIPHIMHLCVAMVVVTRRWCGDLLGLVQV